MARPSGDLVGRVLGARYRLVALVGTGASAQVYLADDVKLRRRVAVKLLHDALADDQAFLRRFRVEAQSAAQLSDPHILVVHDWSDGANALAEPPYLVTEYLEGGSLRGVLDTGYRLSSSQALLIGLQAAQGLEHAHAKGYVHRDIKPANILFGDDGRVRIGDFGLARALAEAAWTEPSGAVLGTVRYAAPEQARGASVDGRADVYALALVLIEAVTGRVPFAADTTIATLMGRVEHPLVAPPEMGALADALAPAGAIDPQERSDAAALVVALERAARLLPRPLPIPVGVAAAPATALVDLDPTDHTGALTPALVPHGVGVRVGSAMTSAPVVDRTADRDTSVPPTGPPKSVPWSPGDDPLTVDGRRTVAGSGTALDDDEEAETGRLEPDAGDLRTDGDGDDLRQHGRTRRRRWPAVLVLFAVLLGAGGVAAKWWSDRPVLHPVPGIVGSSETTAKARLARLHLSLAVAGRQYKEDAPAGRILTQDPITGTKLREGRSVAVTVSRGPTPRTVPSLAGATSVRAGQLLAAQGLRVGATSTVHDETVPAGVVIDWSPKDTLVARGSPITLLVSDGPRPRVVPRVNGFSPANARAALEAVDLKPVIVGRSSMTVPAGEVISTNYDPGSTLARGSTVQVFVSTGPPLVKVPDVRGRPVADAESVLNARGFKVTQTEGSPTGSVTLTRPPAGTLALRGSGVVLITQ